MRKNVYKKNSRRKRRGKAQSRLITFIKGLTGASLVALMGYLFIFCHDMVTQCDLFQASQILVEGAERLNEQELLDQAGIVRGKNILAVNLTLARKRLMAHPWIAQASVGREFPETLRISVVEQDPLAIIDLGRKFIINAQGEIFKEWSRSDPTTLPVVSGLDYTTISIAGEYRSEPFEAVMEMLTLGRDTGSVLPLHRIQRIEVDAEMGLTLFSRDRVRAIKIGYEDYSQKLERLENLLTYMEGRQEFSGLEVIDLNDLNRIVINPATIGATENGRKEI